MQQLNTIFLGVTTSPVRDFVGDIVKEENPQSVILPCVGRFATLAAIIAKGCKTDRIFASDISLFSSIIGYLSDSSKDIDALKVSPRGTLGEFTKNSKDKYDFGAGVMLAIKYLQIKTKNLYQAGIRREIWSNRSMYRDHIRECLQSLCGSIKGIHYDMADVRGVVQGLDGGCFLYVDTPEYKGGYGRMFPDEIIWDSTPSKELEPEDAIGILEPIVSCRAVAYIRHGTESKPNGWHTLLANPINGDRTDYLCSNRPLTRTYTHLSINEKKPKLFMIYDDEEITERSVIAMKPVDEATALYYRDIFVHRLGATAARFYYAMMIDDKIVATVGFFDDNFLTRKTDYIVETFGVVKTSNRYSMLTKLYRQCLTSDDMKRMLESSRQSYTLREPKGIQTSVLSKYPESKQDRGIMRLVSRKPVESGGFHLVYRADFRNDTWPDCLKLWLAKWGNKERG